MVARQHGEFIAALGSTDQHISVTSNDSARNSSRTHIFNALRGAGLGGEILFFSAENRPVDGPIALPLSNIPASVDKPPELSMPNYRVGVYFPVRADREVASDGIGLQRVVDGATNEMYRELALQKTWVPMSDGLVVATQDQIEQWSERGMFAKPVSEHNSTASPEDREWLNKANNDFLPVYADALVDGLAKLLAQGIKPGDLTHGEDLVRRVGKQTAIFANQITNLDHSSVIKKVVARDEGRCQMPLMATYERNGGRLAFGADIPVCNRNLVDYYPKVGPTLARIVLGRANGHANHILPRGAGITAGVKAAFFADGSHTLSHEVLSHPERLLMFLSHMNLAELTALNGIEDSQKTTERLKVVIPLIDAAINNLGNLLFLEEECHLHGYHPDQKQILDAVASLLYGVNSGEIKMPRMGDPEYPSFKAEIVDKILSNQKISSGYRFSYDSAIMLLQQARMTVGLMGVPYWEYLLTRPQQEIARIRTRDYLRREEDNLLLSSLNRLSGVVNGFGAHVSEYGDVIQIVKEHYEQEGELLHLLHPRRRKKKSK